MAENVIITDMFIIKFNFSPCMHITFITIGMLIVDLSTIFTKT